MLSQAPAIDFAARHWLMPRFMAYHGDEQVVGGRVIAVLMLQRHLRRPESGSRGGRRKAICPATGLSVYETWQRELDCHGPLRSIVPEPFDVAVTRLVSRDCLGHFEARACAVPFLRAGQQVEVHGCAPSVQILAGGGVVKEYPRHTHASAR